MHDIYRRAVNNKAILVIILEQHSIVVDSWNLVVFERVGAKAPFEYPLHSLMYISTITSVYLSDTTSSISETCFLDLQGGEGGPFPPPLKLQNRKRKGDQRERRFNSVSKNVLKTVLLDIRLRRDFSENEVFIVVEFISNQKQRSCGQGNTLQINI